MTEKEIFDRIVTIIQERQGEDFAVTEALSLKDDLDADSVDLMEFVLTLEDEFGIEITDEEIDQLQSVADVVAIIKDKKTTAAAIKKHSRGFPAFDCRATTTNSFKRSSPTTKKKPHCRTKNTPLFCKTKTFCACSALQTFESTYSGETTLRRTKKRQD